MALRPTLSSGLPFSDIREPKRQSKDISVAPHLLACEGGGGHSEMNTTVLPFGGNRRCPTTCPPTLYLDYSQHLMTIAYKWPDWQEISSFTGIMTLAQSGQFKEIICRLLTSAMTVAQKLNGMGVIEKLVDGAYL